MSRTILLWVSSSRTIRTRSHTCATRSLTPETRTIMDYKKNHKWTNWAQTLQFQPDLFCQPETVDDVVQVVKDARAKKKGVRVQGAEHSHSWSQFVATNDVLVSLDNLAK